MLKGFKLEASDAMDVVSKLTKVDMEAATSAGSIAESLRQFATTAQLSGVDIDQAIAMATTIMDVSQKDASSVGHALNTMIARYGNVKAGAYTSTNLSEESSDTTEKLNDIEKVLNKIGISMRTTSLEFRDFDEVLEDVAAKWQDLDNVSQNALATAIAGTRQRESFLVLMENMDKYHDLIKTSAESKGTAEEKYLSYTEQLEAAQKRLNAAWEDIALNADVNSFLTKITDVTTFLVKQLPFIFKLGMRILTAFNAYKLPALFELPEKIQKLQGFLGKTASNVTSGFKAFKNKEGKFDAQSIKQGFRNVWEGTKQQVGSNFTKMGQYDPKPASIWGKLQNTINLNIKALRDNTSAIKGETTSTGIDDLTKNQIDPDKGKSSTGAGKLLAGAAQFGLNALVSGATASTTGRNTITGEQYEMSDAAVWSNRIATGLAGAIGSMINPILGPIFSTAMDWFMSNFVSPWFDRVDNLIKHQIEVAEKNLSLLSKIETSTSELTKISKEKDTYENYQKIQEAAADMLDVLKEDPDLSTRLLEVLAEQGYKYNDIYSLMKDWKEDSDSRSEISRQLEIATKQLEYENTIIAKQKELNTSGYSFKDRKGETWTSEADNYRVAISGHEQFLKEYKDIISAETLYDEEQILKALRSAYVKQQEIYNTLNKNLAEQAILGAKTTSGAYLTDLSVNQLKDLGKDEITKIVTEQIQSIGGFQGYDAWSKEGQDIVASVIKADEKLYKIYSQQIYTLDEAVRKNDPELLTQFANAMGVTVDQLDRLSKTMGTLTLADFLKTPTEVRNSFNELSSLFTSLGSSSGLTAENLEKIISDYPQLIGDLGDTHKLATGIIKNMNAYKELYKNTLVDSLLDNTSYFDLLQDKLTEAGATASVDAIKSLDVKTIRELMRSLDKIDKDGTIKAAIDGLFDQDITVDFEKSLLETVINYQSKAYDKQIKNLEEQKTALQEINNQREYENKLIEARNKLEDAQKEKKKIYRAGVGWVYESDQSAILEAQKNLENVTNEKKISEIQAQINQLTGEKEQLTELPDKLELENLKTVYEAWAEELKTSNGTQAQILEKIIEAYKGLNISTSGNDAKNRVEATDENTRSGFTSSLNDLNEAINKLNGDTSTSEYNKGEKQVNTTADELFSKIDTFVTSGGSLDAIPEVKQWYESQKAAREGDSFYRYLDKYNPTFEMGDTGKKYKLTRNAPSRSLANEISNQVIGHKKSFLYYKPNEKQSKMSYSDFVDKYETIDNAINALPSETFVADSKKKEWGVILKGNDAPDGTGIYKVQKAAKGSLGLKGGMSLINELGTEALVTPGGTITSLPSATGVVPADITKNLWTLGEVAPMFAKAMKTGFSDIQGFGTQDKSVDESFNVGTVNMTVNADNTFDVDKWVNELKVKTALSRNIR